MSCVHISSLALADFVRIDVDGSEELADVVQRLELLKRLVDWTGQRAKGSDVTELGYESSVGGWTVYKSGMYGVGGLLVGVPRSCCGEFQMLYLKGEEG